MILSIYFHYENQMEAFFREFKAQLPNTEAAMVNFHYSYPKDSHWNSAGQKSEVPCEDALSWDYLPWLCRKYKVELIDIRTPWIQYMKDITRLDYDH